MLAATADFNEATATRDSTYANIRIQPSHDSYERRQVLRAHIRGISTHVVLSYNSANIGRRCM